MTANPLMRFTPRPTPSVEEHVAMLNKMNWVRASGRPYFVGEKRNPADGSVEHFVDRKA